MAAASSMNLRRELIGVGTPILFSKGMLNNKLYNRLT